MKKLDFLSVYYHEMGQFEVFSTKKNKFKATVNCTAALLSWEVTVIKSAVVFRRDSSKMDYSASIIIENRSKKIADYWLSVMILDNQI